MSEDTTATREDHDDFCTIEGWDLVRGARGKPVQHHRTYKLELPDGDILRTRISKPVDRTQYAKSTWSHVLREQLAVDSATFWSCVKDGIVADRSTSAEERPGIPYHLVLELKRTCGISTEEAIQLTELQAKQKIAEHWRGVAEAAAEGGS